MMAFCNLQAQYKEYKNEIDEKIQSLLEKAQFIGGDEIALLEQNLANYTGSKYALACSNGTSALLLALKALGIKENDEIITTPFTFIASSEMIAVLKAKPVFVDINELDYNIDIDKVKAAITPKTKAVLAVSIFGQMPDIYSLKQLCDEKGIFLIEDAAQSFGAKDDANRYSGSIAHISTTSFFPSKPLGCYGDGGAIFINDEELKNKLSLLINHGSKERYIHEIIGFNARLDSIQAGILNVKLKYFDKELAKRNEIAKIYNENLVNCVTPKIKNGYFSVFAQYSIRVKNRKNVISHLAKRQIPTAVHYPMPLYKQPCFKYLNYDEKNFCVANKISDEILSLPFSAFLSEEEQVQVIKAFKELA